MKQNQIIDSWQNINAEYLARMRLQNRFKTGLEIAKYTASIMRRDMEDYDNDPSQYAILRLLAWFHWSTKTNFNQNISKQIKKGIYIYLDG